MRMWQEVAPSHSHCFAGQLCTRTTAGSHINGCMVKSSVTTNSQKIFCSTNQKATLEDSCFVYSINIALLHLELQTFGLHG